jgi:single stranded DNA-binding protein
VNSVSLIGTLTADPEVVPGRRGGEVCVMRIAVPRRNRSGRREPGVVYVEAAAFGADALECAARLRAGDAIGVSGRIEREEYRTREGQRRVDHAVLIDQLDLLSTTSANSEEERR